MLDRNMPNRSVLATTVGISRSSLTRTASWIINLETSLRACGACRQALNRQRDIDRGSRRSHAQEQRGEAHADYAKQHRSTLVANAVENSTSWQLAEQTAHRSNGQCEADRLRWPLVLHQINGDEGTETRLHRRDKEVHAIEATTATSCCLDMESWGTSHSCRLRPLSRSGRGRRDAHFHRSSCLQAMCSAGDADVHSFAVRHRDAHRRIGDADLNRAPAPTHCKRHAAPGWWQARNSG